MKVRIVVVPILCLFTEQYQQYICINCNIFLIFVTDEDLIKWGWPEDVWFHVDKVSSAHVYLRLTPVSLDY